ncbi:sulfotransferase [Streptomyces sp. ID05-04B]|uniref:sulfotransferase family protein n=1 Tax=unclassified Streptomyces TaxID=2593676 RepID=UPI000D1A5BA1|nr:MULTISPECIES: sulfotransferase [unclassified Streptomyces]AVV40210.1 sulfotransferase [Streptomyces sp. P3]MDX5569322.1 sulfotransferase [Streptomyces sp. ID05-04B]
MSSSPLALTVADLLLRPGFASRRTPDRVFDRLSATARPADGDEEFTEEFRRLLRHWSRDENLTPVGWWSAQGHVRRHLANRARVRRLIAEHPGIAREPIERPVFVVGLPRTATTLTHGVLSLSEQHRCPLLWELLAPDLEGSPERRRRAITAARLMVGAIDLFAPRYRDIHPLAAEGPEECTFALPHTVMPLSQARVPAYRAALEERDFVPDYAYLKQVYQVLQYGRPRRRWVLKSPLHTGNLDALLAVFPDATLVWTHRDPAVVVASFCSLIEHGMAITRRPLDLHELGATWLALLSRSVRRGLAARAAVPREALVDVPYSWLGSDPATGAPKLYDAVGARWTDADAARLPRIAARPKGSRPHSYDLARYGLTRADVDTAFADYDVLRAEVDRA